ncbi:MAG: hypothetical protein EOM63_02750 [Clostridia bacterium]|nr:hypothetical protein [Clostridia bacterium]
MFMTTALALALSGALQTTPVSQTALTVSPPAVIAYNDVDSQSTAQATTDSQDGTPNATAQPAAPSVSSVEAIPDDVASAAQALQDEITSVMTPPAAEPTPTPTQPVTPANPATPSNQALYGTVLGTYTTSYSTKQANRCTNIRLAATAVNGTVLSPGETFSFNTVVGQRTTARGYKEAHVFSGGQVTEGVGGGICQVSSTLFNAAMLADMQITARVNHGLPVSYVPAGRDATVSWGGPEFKFKNPYSYAVKITAGYDSAKGTVTLSILGPKSAAAPKTKVSVTQKGASYVTRRYSNDKVTYTTSSTYKTAS